MNGLAMTVFAVMSISANTMPSKSLTGVLQMGDYLGDHSPGRRNP
jgi:hypothetical protein